MVTASVPLPPLACWPVHAGRKQDGSDADGDEAPLEQRQHQRGCQHDGEARKRIGADPRQDRCQARAIERTDEDDAEGVPGKPREHPAAHPFGNNPGASHRGRDDVALPAAGQHACPGSRKRGEQGQID